MTVPKVLAVAALLLAAAAAAQTIHIGGIYEVVQAPPDDFYGVTLSVGPYNFDPWSTVHVYLPWFPPHAVPMKLKVLNVTWWKPETIWLIGTYPVRVSGVGTVPATIYVVQDGVRMNLQKARPPHIFAGFIEWHVQHICAQGIAMVDPIKIIELNPTTQIWISDVYCLYGDDWFWLRLLPYKLRDYLIAEGVEAVEFRDPKISIANLPGKPPGDYVIPAGWYLDPAAKRVFRIPNDTAVMAELQRLRMRISDLEAELANKTAQLARLNATAAQLNSTIAQLNASLAEAREEAARLSAENQRLRAQLEALNYTYAQLEAAYKPQLEALRAVETQLAQLTAENQALKTQIASMNEAFAKLNEEYASQTAQLQTQIETWTRAAWIGAALGAAAGAAATALALRRRR